MNLPALSSGLNNNLFGQLSCICFCFKTNQYRQININLLTNFGTYRRYFWEIIQGEITRTDRQTDRQTGKALYARNSTMSVREVGQIFCLVESRVRLQLEIWCKKSAFLGIRAANRTGKLRVPVIDCILACGFT